MAIMERRGERVALVGLILQGLLFLALLVLFRVSQSPAVLCQAWFLLGGVGIWLLIFVELYQNRLAVQQRQETEELTGRRLELPGGSQSVFDQLGPEELLPMERRLKLVKRWFVPIVSILVAGYHFLLAGLLLPNVYPMRWLTDALEAGTRHEARALAIVAGAALICFVVGKYAMGLSRTPGYRILRAGANYLTGNAISLFALAIVLGFANYGYPVPQRILVVILPILLLLLGAEIVLNLVLDIYRPRVPGAEYRPAYESRLLGLFTEPGGIMRSLAHTIDYQFGFEVSETWFYKLLQRAIPPLALFLAGALYALSCVVIVQPGHQAVVTHWGKMPDRTLGPGAHIKWPWPIDKAAIYTVDQIQQMVIGYKEQITPDYFRKAEPILWTATHAPGGEYQILVASETGREGGEQLAEPAEGQSERLLPVNILAGALILHYQIDPEKVLDYVAHYTDAPQMLEAIAYREWIRFMASVDPMEVMTGGRQRATEEMKRRIQAFSDENRLGIKIVRVMLVGVHPPVEVADAFEAAINAIQERETLIWQAKGYSNQTLPRAQAEALEKESSAKADRYKKLTIERAEVGRFLDQLAAYEKAPEVYKTRQYLRMFEESTEKVRKYIVASKHPERIILIINDEEKVPAGLLNLGEQITETIGEGEQ